MGAPAPTGDLRPREDTSMHETRTTTAPTWPPRECPSYERCSAPLCPLDPRQSERHAEPGDERCRAERPTRARIAALYPDLLPGGGLTAREIARDMHSADAHARLAAMTPAQREDVAARLARGRAALAAKHAAAQCCRSGRAPEGKDTGGAL